MDFSTAIVVVEGNHSMQPLPIHNGEYQDAHCGMVLVNKQYAGQVIAPNGKTWFFHDQGGIPLWLENRSFKNSAKIWVFTKDSQKWIEVRKAWFSLTDDTPMHYGFAAYERKKKYYIDYDQMRLKMLRGENMLDPQVKKRLLGLKNGTR